MFKPRVGRRGRGLNVCWRRAVHSPASQTLEFNDRSPSRREPGDRTLPRRRRAPPPPAEPLYQNYEAFSLRARVYGHLDVIGSGVGRIERHLSSSCGSIDHWRAGGEASEESTRGRRLQWVLLQRWLPRDITYDTPRPCCPHHRPPPHYDTPFPARRPPPRPSCSFHNLPESYQTERENRSEGREVLSEGREAEEEAEEERTDWSFLIPEEEGSFFDDADYDSESDNTPPRTPSEPRAGPSAAKDASPGPSTSGQ